MTCWPSAPVNRIKSDAARALSDVIDADLLRSRDRTHSDSALPTMPNAHSNPGIQRPIMVSNRSSSMVAVVWFVGSVTFASSIFSLIINVLLLDDRDLLSARYNCESCLSAAARGRLFRYSADNTSDLRQIRRASNNLQCECELSHRSDEMSLVRCCCELLLTSSLPEFSMSR